MEHVYVSHGEIPPPLVCWGCAHAASEAPYPGRPSGEHPCLFCIRNPERQRWQEELTSRGTPRVAQWYGGSKPVRVPMDCYHSPDMAEQIARWMQAAKGLPTVEEGLPSPEATAAKTLMSLLNSEAVQGDEDLREILSATLEFVQATDRRTQAMAALRVWEVVARSFDVIAQAFSVMANTAEEPARVVQVLRRIRDEAEKALARRESRAEG